MPRGSEGKSKQKKNLEGIKGAAEDQQAVVAQRRHHPQSGEVADQVDLPDTRVVVDHLEGKRL